MPEPIPQLGDVIYVERGDLTSGTWVRGGKATVSRVLSDWRGLYVGVIEIPGTLWDWETLSLQQKSLEAEYGEVIAGQKMIGDREWE